MSEYQSPRAKPPELLKTLEKLEVDIIRGRVFGLSGNEFRSVGPDDRVRCSIYCAELIKTFSIVRYHIIWWKAKGEWPTQLIDHINEIPWHDWIGNLQYLTHSKNIIKNAKVKGDRWTYFEGSRTPWIENGFKPTNKKIKVSENQRSKIPYGAPWLIDKK